LSDCNFDELFAGGWPIFAVFQDTFKNDAKEEQNA